MQMEQALPRLGVREAAGIVFLLASAGILTALAYEHIGGYEPCHLCLLQRWAYYFAIPVSLVAVMTATRLPALAAGALALCGLAFAINAGLGVYHAGVEWHWWPGPAECSGGVSLAREAEKLLQSLQEAEVVRCDQPAFRFLGLSFAGYNVLLSSALAVVAILGVASTLRR